MNKDLAIVGIIIGWIALGLALERDADLWAQWALGAVTWLLLIALARTEDWTVCVQIGVVVVLATAVEYTAAPLLGFYAYRLDNVPAFVPPGHGLVYLAALALGRSAIFALTGPLIQRLALGLGAVWAVWGIALAERIDWFGLLLFALFLGFAISGRAPLVYAAAFFITGYLELLGTWAGAWTWALTDPSGLIAMGNPPSGIAAGYCLLDAAALAAGPVVQRFLERFGKSLRLPPSKRPVLYRK